MSSMVISVGKMSLCWCSMPMLRIIHRNSMTPHLSLDSEHAECNKLQCRTQKSRQKSPSGHHSTTLSGYIFATTARIDNRKKNLLSSNISSRCPHNMVNFGLVAAEIVSGVWAPQLLSTAFASWQRYCTASSSGHQPNCGVEQRAPPIFGRATITGIGPHSSYEFFSMIM